jgi:chitin disaccharide deacetylase
MRAGELLGYPADARVLIVNCDDFGLSEGVNAAVIEAIEDGIAASCSLMTPCPGAPDALRLLRDRPELPFGVHLTLVCESTVRPWGPVAGRERVPSLLDDDGALFAPGHRERLFARARIEEVEVEFRAQIEAAADAGRAPTHLDFHCLADGGRPDILDLTMALAREYGTAVRVWLDPGRRRARRQRLPVVDHDFLDSFSLALDDKTARYAQALRDLPAGLSEWAVHPGGADARSRSLDPGGWRVRRSDHRFLTSPLAQELLREQHVTVIDYRPLQRAWAGIHSGK